MVKPVAEGSPIVVLRFQMGTRSRRQKPKVAIVGASGIGLKPGEAASATLISLAR
jgi:hypothetical protein